VQVEVGLEFLAPGVQDGQKAWSTAELIFGKFQQGLGDGGEQAVEHQPFMIQDHGIELMRQGEDDMEVGNRQDLLFSFGQPSLAGHVLAFGAVAVSAGVIGDAQAAAGVAAVHPAAHLRSAAV
jgi:hypothetical protein